MKKSMGEVSTTLQSAYDEFYSDQLTAWREIGGKYKAMNILIDGTHITHRNPNGSLMLSMIVFQEVSIEISMAIGNEGAAL